MAEPDPAYRVVALDLDGTTVRSDGTIGARTRVALRRVEAAGVTVMAVTGRPPRWMHGVLPALGPRGVAICANGAVVLDLADGRVVEQRSLDRTALRRLVDELSAALPGLRFAVETSDEQGFRHEPDYRPKWSTDARTVETRRQLTDEPAIKLLARHDRVDADTLLARARTVVDPQLATLTHSNSRDSLLEISAAGVSKATTLELLCERRGIGPRQVIAFGDMPNDIPLLSWAGHSVAVANAHPEVLAVADEVTASNDAEGVADVLDRLWPPPP